MAPGNEEVPPGGLHKFRLAPLRVEKPWGLSSPFLFVIGDDRVTCYIGTDDDTGVDDVGGGASEAYHQREGMQIQGQS
ncbi:hypothetical protein DEO72_LG11g1275 [Vigna unguiculata]|uniref:Uncharacterized protein n=1 Tax=Vigna unguiculata TaxID=3917 RepID=A0A4D6NKW4_VIGUN|nr:hypothetical protein DEO72_LG11g1275 [Vigna unguiculata]